MKNRKQALAFTLCAAVAMSTISFPVLAAEENPSGEEAFFENYALQATFTMDSSKCKDIVADGATIANVGADKQLTYTILPGQGAEIEITADVIEFEMDSVAINGISLNLDIDLDAEEIQAKIDEVISAVNALDAGASELEEGSKDLSDATGLLAENTNKLHTGVGMLKGGMEELSSGLLKITKKNQELLNGGLEAFKGICSAAETALNVELEANGLETVTLTPQNYSKVLTELLTILDADAVYDQAYDTALKKVTEEVEEAVVEEAEELNFWQKLLRLFGV